MKQQIATAETIASFLENDPRVASVSYPGLPSFPQASLARKQMRDDEGAFAPGCLLFFVLKGKNPKDSRRRGEKFINYLARHAYTITLAVSLGNIRTLVEHPSSMTHSAIPLDEQIRKGINPGGVRLSIGIEKPEDIMHDLTQALNHL